MLDQSLVSGLSLPSSQPAVARLYRYFVAGAVLHAISAALYQEDCLLMKTRPIHCHTLTEQGLQMHLQSILEAFSRHSGVLLDAFHEVDNLLIEAHTCPVRDCHLNPAFRLEELL